MPSKIEDYALIGDCETAALVSRDGSIDWLCWPRFDSGACFAALLGTPDHGRWRIAPQGEARATRRRYLPGTLVLETVFETDTGSASVTDLMTARLPGTAGARDDTSDLIRIVRGLSGTVDMRMDLTLRFDYGASIPWVSRVSEVTGAPPKAVRHSRLRSACRGGAKHDDTAHPRSHPWREPLHRGGFHRARR